jgi:tripartite-type tricarboxylate transporter receptor subunit TctC
VIGGFLAPVGTPQDVIDKLAKVVNELNGEPETIERQLKIGWLSYQATPAEMRKQVTAHAEAYKNWVQKANFKLD